jgi:short-subunit dehydrogenase
MPGPLMSVYFATKHYVLAFSEALAEELRDTGVRVTALCPPPVNTPFVGTAGTAPGNYMATTSTSPAEVAHYGYRMMKRGKTVAVYSLTYKFLTAFLVRTTPRFALRRLLHRMNAQGYPSASTPRASIDQHPA